MTDETKTKLREVVMDLLADSAVKADGESYAWMVTESMVDRLCILAGLGSTISALDEIEREGAAYDANLVTQELACEEDEGVAK